MDFTHTEFAIQERSSALQNVMSGLRKVFSSDPGIALQLLVTGAVIAAGSILHMNVVQWILVSLVTLMFNAAGIFRTAAILQINHDPSYTPFQASRIRFMGNALLTITAGLSLFTYLMVFIPKISMMM